MFKSRHLKWPCSRSPHKEMMTWRIGSTALCKCVSGSDIWCRFKALYYWRDFCHEWNFSSFNWRWPNRLWGTGYVLVELSIISFIVLGWNIFIWFNILQYTHLYKHKRILAEATSSWFSSFTKSLWCVLYSYNMFRAYQTRFCSKFTSADKSYLT